MYQNHRPDIKQQQKRIIPLMVNNGTKIQRHKKPEKEETWMRLSASKGLHSSASCITHKFIVKYGDTEIVLLVK